MLILKDTIEGSNGVWFDFVMRGETVKLKIRPISNEAFDEIRKKHTKLKSETNPSTRALVKKEIADEDKINEEIIDYIFESFEGFLESDKTPVEVNLRNKKRIINIPIIEGETPIYDFIYSKAKELSAISEEEADELEKN